MSAYHVGQLVRRIRIAHGLTVAQGAALAGLTRQGLSKIESGECGASLGVAARLCSALSIDAYTLMRAADEKDS